MIEFLGGNTLTLLQNGADYFPALESAIDRAVRWVYLETYIFANDATGQRIAAALLRAAQRGVATFLLIDGYGVQVYPPISLKALREAGVETLIFRPEISPLRFQRQRLRRLHRKLAVIDQQVAFVGGINFVDDIDARTRLPRFDFAAQVEGPLVASILREMRSLHNRVARAQLHTPRMKQESTAVPETTGDTRAAFLLRSSLRHRRDIEQAYLQAIAEAQHEIILANAYFLPGHRFRKALITAAERGVDVHLLLQGFSDHPWVHYATRGLYAQLLAAGIGIYEYQSGEMHAKAAVIDGHWATVGSSNIDPMSLMLSREANIVVDAPAFALTLATRLRNAMQNQSLHITHVDWRKRAWPQRILSRAAFSLVRALASWIGYGMEQGKTSGE
jgi:cardiolipin synthase A/B